jgi:triphosphoribosyl-dephospho-CoA synthetase
VQWTTTGYIPGAEALEVVGQQVRDVIRQAKERGVAAEEIVYLLDRESRADNPCSFRIV